MYCVSTRVPLNCQLNIGRSHTQQTQGKRQERILDLVIAKSSGKRTLNHSQTMATIKVKRHTQLHTDTMFYICVLFYFFLFYMFLSYDTHTLAKSPNNPRGDGKTGKTGAAAVAAAVVAVSIAMTKRSSSAFLSFTTRFALTKSLKTAPGVARKPNFIFQSTMSVAILYFLYSAFCI